MVSDACPGRMLTWFISRMAALLRPVGLFPLPSPPYFFPLLISVTTAWRPGRGKEGTHCWVAGNASHGSANQPLNIPGTQPSFRNVVANAQRTLTISLPFRAFALWVVFEIEWKIFIKLLWRWSQTLALIHAR